MKRLLIIAGVIVGLGALWGGYSFFQVRNGTPVLRTVPMTRGDLLITINATGTVEPEEVIDVGAQVAGQIIAFGNDIEGKSIDYGSVVEAGTVLARIDDAVYRAEMESADAQVQSAQAGVLRTQADLAQLQSKLLQADRDWQRAQKLGPSEALAQSNYDAYLSAYESAKAGVAVGQAAIAQAQAALAQAHSMQQRARRNLGFCTITSPVRGVIIDRRVNIGQTVVASLNAPSLFLIAKDLTRMQVWVAVNEADIGKIKAGLPVSFTVDAFPGETFKGEVGKVRLNAAMTQNVVTYTVEIVTDNPNGRLLPYLTANVLFELQRLDDGLLLPNAALRWQPSPAQIAPPYRPTAPTETGRRDLNERFAGGRQRVVWTPEGKYVRPLTVKVGLSDGVSTAVSGETISAGLPVVIGVQSRDTVGDNDAANPFTPRFRSRGRSGAAAQ